MTPASAMVLTGKQALDYSGAVSAEDNFGIGGYERIMGPNGQAQYWAPDLDGACRLLLDYYEHTYVAPGERFPRRAETADPIDRDVRDAPHQAPGSTCARRRRLRHGEPGRKKPFDIRPSCAPWPTATRAARALGRDAPGRDRGRLGRPPRRLARDAARDRVAAARPPRPDPSDGPEQWTSGTLFPRSSKKSRGDQRRERAPSVVLANLAGFDGSPESMREWQLEYGAEIGRAVVNFDGPIVFCVVSRYHGGAFVVFSQRLNENLETVGPRLARVGHRRRPGRRGRVRARRRAGRGADPASSRSTSGSGPPMRPSACGCGPSGPSCGPTCCPRSAASWPPSSTRRTASSVPYAWDRCADHRARNAPLPHRRGRARHRARARRPHPKRP